MRAERGLRSQAIAVNKVTSLFDCTQILRACCEIGKGSEKAIDIHYFGKHDVLETSA